VQEGRQALRRAAPEASDLFFSGTAAARDGASAGSVAPYSAYQS
jgi:hypothetical protein